MGTKYSIWDAKAALKPQNLDELVALIRENRAFESLDKLEYGDYGLQDTIRTVRSAIKAGKRIALYADYDVDGTMSAVSWIWFLEAIGHHNYLHYIPCRFREGYGVNLNAVKHLIENEKAELIITMDTGITANEEAAYCKAHGVEFICTDHHKIQPDKMPDCVVLNPKMHPDERYQEMCGCGITFVLLRKLGEEFAVPQLVWNDLLALVGMATICDVVPLNGVNHRLARLGVQALIRSKREVFVKLRQATAMLEGGDEKDVSFRIGPRINAVGRLEHADAVINAFIGKDTDTLVQYMGECNDRRKAIQQKIIKEALEQAQLYPDAPILFLGGDWHPGVVGIAASKISETFWKPTWLFNRNDTMCKGSARSISFFDVTDAMGACKDLFVKFGGHRAAGGFSFDVDDEAAIRERLIAYAEGLRQANPMIWQSRVSYDCELAADFLDLELVECLDELKPFGHGFEEPKFALNCHIETIKYFNDKLTGERKHTAVYVPDANGGTQKIMFFNEVLPEWPRGTQIKFLTTVAKNNFRGVTSLELYGVDWMMS